jgi:hypothetical protein
MTRVLIILLLATSNLAQAQIGWTLDQCRKQFGHESSERCPLDDDPTIRTFPLHVHFHADGHRGFDGRFLYLGFDPDGTVGKIIWWKWGGEFSDEEINHLLKEASAVSWRRVSVHNDLEDGRWVGEQNGKIIFDALEDDTGTGGWILTIATR